MPAPARYRASVWGHAPLLALVVASLAVGPLLAWAWPGGRAWRAFLDGLSLALVGGLSLLHLAPHAVSEGGLAAVAAGAVGFLGPALAHRTPGPGRGAWMALAALAVLVHSAFDGAALGVAGGALALAVAGHQVPVGLGIWALAHRVDGLRVRPAVVGWGAIAAVSAATVVGFVAGPPLLGWLPEAASGALEALVAGALLHVVFDAAGDHDHAHDPAPVAPAPPPAVGLRVLGPVEGAHPFVRPPAAPVVAAHGHERCRDHDHGHSTAATRAWSSVGALLGVAGVVAASQGGEHAVAHLGGTLRTFVRLALDGAPGLLAGYGLAALVAVVVPEIPDRWLVGGTRLGQAARGVVFGLPLPVCACGVLPLYASLVRRGVPATAALAFLVATPELGPDTVLFGLPLLGAPFVVARAVAALGGAIAVAMLVGHTIPPAPPSARAEETAPRPALERLRAGVRFGAVDLVDHTLPWILLALGAAALAEPLLDHDLLRAVPAPLQVPLFAALGVPLYVGASGATPLAAVAVHKGASAGAAMAFLLAGPATSLPGFALLSRLHGPAVAVRFAIAVAGVAVLAGWTVDLLHLPVAPVAHAPAPTGAQPLAVAAAAALVVLGTASLFRQGARGVVQQLLTPIHGQ